jgi:hypothetical protein
MKLASVAADSAIDFRSCQERGTCSTLIIFDNLVSPRSSSAVKDVSTSIPGFDSTVAAVSRFLQRHARIGDISCPENERTSAFESSGVASQPFVGLLERGQKFQSHNFLERPGLGRKAAQPGD